jgi:hypothetical protein
MSDRKENFSLFHDLHFTTDQSGLIYHLPVRKKAAGNNSTRIIPGFERKAYQ